MKRSFDFRPYKEYKPSRKEPSFPLASSLDAPRHLKPFFDDRSSSSQILSPIDLNSQRNSEHKDNESDRSNRLFSSFMSVDSDQNDDECVPDQPSPPKTIASHSSEAEEMTNVSIARFRKQIENYRENLVTERLKNIGLRNGQKSVMEELEREKSTNSELAFQARKSKDEIGRLEQEFADKLSQMEREFKVSLDRKVSEISFLNQTIRTLQDSLASHKPNRLSEMVSKLTQQVAQQSERNQTLENELDIRERNLKQKEREVVEQGMAVRRLEHKIEDGAIYCQQLQKHLDVKSKSEVELHRKLQRQNQMIEELNAKLNVKVHEASQRHTDRETEISRIRACLMEEQQRNARYKRQLKSAQHESEQHKLEAMMLHKQLKEQSDVHNLQILKLTDSINHKERTHDGNVRALYEENQRLSSEYARVLEENAKYQSAFVQSNGSKEEVHRLHKCLKDKDEQIELLQRDLLRHGQTEPIRTRSVSVQTSRARDLCRVNDEDVWSVDTIRSNIKNLHDLIRTYVEEQEIDENILAKVDCLPDVVSPMKRDARPASDQAVRAFRQTLGDILVDTNELRRCICEQMADSVGNQCFVQ